MTRRAYATTTWLAAGALALAAAGPSLAKDRVTVAVPTFLTGAGAPAFGVPARNGAEIIAEAMNAGKLPAPYDSKGLAGAEIVLDVYDESGGNTKQLTEFRNKVQKQGVDLFVGIVSSGTCQAVTPVAEELKVLTILAVCGTPRVFEELDPEPKYVFRSMNNATADGIAAAHYIKAKFPSVKGYTGINQNYAWGQDSWRDFDLGMRAVSPEIKGADDPQWPKLFSGQYGAEVSALLLSEHEAVHSSLWGGDLEAFIFQAGSRGLFQRKKMLLSVAGTAVYRLGKKMPEGVILGARGPYGIFAAKNENPLNKWFVSAYVDRYGTKPTGPSYQYAQGMLAAKYAYDMAAKANGGNFPTTEQVIAALEGAKVPVMSTTLDFSRGKGHQAITDHVYGVTKWDADAGEQVMVETVSFPAECVSPPDGTKGEDWIKAGMPGAKC